MTVSYAVIEYFNFFSIASAADLSAFTPSSSTCLSSSSAATLAASAAAANLSSSTLCLSISSNFLFLQFSVFTKDYCYRFRKWKVNFKRDSFWKKKHEIHDFRQEWKFRIRYF